MRKLFCLLFAPCVGVGQSPLFQLSLRHTQIVKLAQSCLSDTRLQQLFRALSSSVMKHRVHVLAGREAQKENWNHTTLQAWASHFGEVISWMWISLKVQWSHFGRCQKGRVTLRSVISIVIITIVKVYQNNLTTCFITVTTCVFTCILRCSSCNFSLNNNLFTRNLFQCLALCVPPWPPSLRHLFPTSLTSQNTLLKVCVRVCVCVHRHLRSVAER